MDMIANKEADFREVVAHSLNIFKQKFEYFVDNVEALDSLFQVSFSAIHKVSGKIFSKCGKCFHFMKVKHFNTTTQQ